MSSKDFNRYKKIKKRLTLVSIAILILIVYMIYVINSSGTRQVEVLQMMIKQEVVAHFDNILITRRWNAEHGGVYVKQKEGLEPNAYLKDNYILSDKNEKYLKINPAWMTREISELANKTGDYYYRMLSSNPINPDNGIKDEFEKNALDFFEKNRDEKYYIEFDSKEKLRINFMGVLKTEESCLECHAMQGYKVGDVRGGIRVSLPAMHYAGQLDAIKTKRMMFIVLVVIIVAMVIITFFYFLRSIRDSIEKDKKLSEQERQISMADLLVSVSHYWRQPLTALSLSIQDLRDAYKFGELDEKYLDNMVDVSMKSTQRMSDIIDSFNNIFQKDEKKVQFDVFELIRSSLKIFKQAIDENGILINIRCQNDGNKVEATLNDVSAFKECDGMISSYPRSLSHAISNIIKNSIDALSESKTGNKMINISVSFYKSRCAISIEDNGGGISEEIIEKVFDPYFTTKSVLDSSGMGLYISKKIVENLLLGNLYIKSSFINTEVSIIIDKDI